MIQSVSVTVVQLFNFPIQSKRNQAFLVDSTTCKLSNSIRQIPTGLKLVELFVQQTLLKKVSN